jgi:hypothetical protein
MPRQLKIIMGLVVANMVIGIAVTLAGGYWPQWSTLLVMLGGALYVVIFDPMNRWPDSSWHRRIGRLLTFDRGEGK